MKKFEKGLVAALFVLVIVLFSFAERERKKLFLSYYGHDMVQASVKKNLPPAGSPVAAPAHR